MLGDFVLVALLADFLSLYAEAIKEGGLEANVSLRSDDYTCQNCDRHIASALTAHRAHRLDVGGDIDELVFRPNPELL